jgi:Family of unknown function (DUF5989)
VVGAFCHDRVREVLVRSGPVGSACGRDLEDDLPAKLGELAARNWVRKKMLSFAQELWGFLRERKKFWLLPIIIMTAVLGGLIILAQGSAVAPFIYTLF